MNTVIKDKWKQFINKVKSIQYKEIIKTGFNDLFKDPFFILTHPINGFSKFKSEGMRKRYVAITYLILMCLTQVIAFNGSGFLVNSKDPMRFNALRTISLVIIPVILVTVGNWSITSLFNGKGKMEEIFSVVCYSFAPFVWISLPNILYSNFLVIEEVGFYQAFNMIGIVLLGFMLFFGLLVIHEYGLLQTAVTLVFTVLAIGVIIFIVFLFFTIFQQVYSFIYSLYREFIMRFM